MGKKPKILVVGSFVMDQIVTTRVFPRQGQTILAERFNKAPGGKGANQAQAPLLQRTFPTALSQLREEQPR